MPAQRRRGQQDTGEHLQSRSAIPVRPRGSDGRGHVAVWATQSGDADAGGNGARVFDTGGTDRIFARIVSTDAQANLADQPMAVDVTAALVDQDGSERLSLARSDFPARLAFSLGAASGSG